MKSGLPTSIKFLLISAYLVVMILGGLFGIAIYRFGPPGLYDWLIYAVFASFMIHSIVIITVIHSYYPSGEVPLIWPILLWITTIALWLVDIFLVVQTSERVLVNLSNIFTRPAQSAPFIAFFLGLLLQFYNSIAAIRLLLKIRRNREKELSEMLL